MSVNCNIIIKEATKGFSTRIREYFQSKGVATHILTDLIEGERLLKELARPILLFDLPDSAKDADKVIETYMAATAYHPYPLLVVGKNALQYEEQLNTCYKLATGIRKPASNSDLLEAARYISESFSFPNDGIPEAQATPKVTFESTPHQSAPEKPVAEKPAPAVSAPSTSEPTKIIESASLNDLPDLSTIHEIYKAFDSIPEMFFSQISKFNLFDKVLYGREYTQMMKVSDITNKAYLPSNPEVLKILEEMTEKLPKWSTARIHRIGYLTNTILDALDTSASCREDARIAALLYNWVLATDSNSLLRKDYVTNRSRVIRKDVCSRIKDSAMKIALDLRLPTAGDIVAKIARLIGREESVAENEGYVIASIIASVDMIDRACWQSNHFNPRSAHKILNMAKKGELTEIHPAGLCCIIKILTEAIASSTQLLLIPKTIRKDPELQAAAKIAREIEIRDNEEKVAISDLAPGMRLSRPLVAFDGREILREDLILDQDLIWRIWQLSLVRPLNAPHVVTRSNSEKSTA